MRAFEFATASDVAHALDLLTVHGPSTKIVAGGTDLLPHLKSDGRGVSAVVDISRIAELKRIVMADDGLRIGALVTHAEIMRSALLREGAPALAEAAHAIGAAQTRNLGTIGGNLMTCVPSMDSGPLLLALDAWVSVASARGAREMPIAELFLGPRKTSLEGDELLTEIGIPKRSLGKPAVFMKFGLRKGQALSLVNVAVSLWLDRDTNMLREVAVTLGAVAPTVMHAIGAEEFLEDNVATPEVFAEAGRLAAAEAKPISDFRASARYRRDLVAVLTARALQAACDRATTGPMGMPKPWK